MTKKEEHLNSIKDKMANDFNMLIELTENQIVGNEECRPTITV